MQPGIQTGLGPFISVFYAAVRHWNPGQIGILLGCQSLAGVVLQSSAGHLVDASHHKRWITGAAAITVALAAASIAIIAAVVGTWLPSPGIFYAAAAFAGGMALSVAFITASK